MCFGKRCHWQLGIIRPDPLSVPFDVQPLAAQVAEATLMHWLGDTPGMVRYNLFESATDKSEHAEPQRSVEVNCQGRETLFFSE